MRVSNFITYNKHSDTRIAQKSGYLDLTDTCKTNMAQMFHARSYHILCHINQ